MGRDDGPALLDPAVPEFQSTRPHGARHQSVAMTYIGCKVSIHAPAWGATTVILHVDRSILPFQSTRPHGARLSDEAPTGQVSMFQSTRPHGARQKRNAAMPTGNEFQSTRPHGARPCRYRKPRGMITFQSTRPHGARRASQTALACLCCFNPRARMGRDLASVTAENGDPAVSIHAPAWGATVYL